MTRLDDPELVAREYADETRLMRRARGFAGVGTARDARVPLVAEVVAASPRRVLEVGCGWGELAEWIARDTGATVVATDLSPRMVELALERGVDAHVADVQALPFPDASFDLVVAAWMLYHVPDLPRAVAEVARVLEPRGTFAVATNARTHLQELRELVGSGPSPSTFTRENGTEQLAAHFDHFRRIDIDGVLTFDSREEVEDYVQASIAMSPFVDNLPAELELPFEARTCSSVFVATRRS